MPLLSKSQLMAYRQCPKRLWLEKHEPEKWEESASPGPTVNHGHQVGALARTLYPIEQGVRGELIDLQHTGLEAALARTQALMKAGQPIYEAALAAEGTVAFADALLPVQTGGERQWRLIEVKAATRVKAYYHDDVAIQTYVARKAGVQLAKVELAHIDKEWVYPGEQDYQGLLTEADLTEDALGRSHEVRDWIKQSQKLIATDREPDVEVGRQCTEPHPCGFYTYCTRNHVEAEYPIRWLPAAQSRVLRAEIERGATDMRDLPDALLNGIQLRVKQATVSGREYFDKAGAAADLARYSLPGYFLDFESIQFAVPRWKGTSPYQQICFQFSLHRLGRSGALTHKEFLDITGDDPSAAFAEALVAACGRQGPIFVYHINFERSRVKELANHFSELREQLLNISARMVDLLPIAKNRYYHPSQRGSWSIKKVLPAVAPDLRYEELEGVQSGTMAMDAYLEAIAPATPAPRRAEIREQLLRYCELDTYAMVRIWQYFSGRESLQAAGEAL